MKSREIVMAVICVGVLAVAVQALEKSGGWSDAKVDDPNVVAAAKFAVGSHKKVAMDRIVKAKQQVVAGLNYGVHLQVTDRSSGKPVPREAEAVIYQNLDDEYSLTSWKWK